MKYQVTVDLQFEVTVPCDAENEEVAEQIVEQMKLADLLEWSGCSSYSSYVTNVEEDD